MVFKHGIENRRPPQGQRQENRMRRDRRNLKAHEEVPTYDCTEEEDDFDADIIFAHTDVKGTHDSDGSQDRKISKLLGESARQSR